jgi:hypothetical protein
MDEQASKDHLDAQRYRALRWVMCASKQQQEQAQQWLDPLLDNGQTPTPALLDAALDLLAAYVAKL